MVTIKNVEYFGNNQYSVVIVIGERNSKAVSVHVDPMDVVNCGMTAMYGKNPYSLDREAETAVWKALPDSVRMLSERLYANYTEKLAEARSANDNYNNMLWLNA
jgi:hypothetical protein